jgi:putative hydrolase of the HAD superfamily
LLCAQYGIDPKHALLADDMAQNLAPAKQLGYTTVRVDNGSERGNHGYDEALIDFRVADIVEWLESILGDENDE